MLNVSLTIGRNLTCFLLPYLQRFQEELQGHQGNIERIKLLADEIFQACHPNAVRFVKYYLTITHTRWEQLLNRWVSRTSETLLFAQTAVQTGSLHHQQ